MGNNITKKDNCDVRISLDVERFNYYRVQLLEEAVWNQVLNKIIEKYVKSSKFDSLEAFLNVNRHSLLSMYKANKSKECKCGQSISFKSKRPLEKHQWDALFESNSQSQCGFMARKTMNLTDDMFDVSLSSLLILELKMFGSHLSDKKRRIAIDAVQQIRTDRNYLHHKMNKKIKDDEFHELWRKSAVDILDLATVVSHEFRRKMQHKIDVILLGRKNDNALGKPLNKAVAVFVLLTLLAVACSSTFPLSLKSGNVEESKNCTLFSTEEVTKDTQIIAVFGEATGLVSNHLVGDKCFKSGQAGPVTSATFASTTILGEQLLVVNMPSLADTTASEIAKCNKITLLGVDLVLYSVEISRYSIEESKALDDIIRVYGKKVEDNIMVVFVGTERLQSHGLTLPQFVETFDDSSTLKKFFKKSQNHLIFPSTDYYATEPVRAILKEIKTRGHKPLSLSWPDDSKMTKI